MPSPALARRLAAAAAALLGLVLTVVGAWFAILLGPHGTASFSAQAAGPVVVGPDVLNRVHAPATVTATAASGPVFLGAAVPQDTTDAVGDAKHSEAVVAHFPGETLELREVGTSDLADPTAYHVWRVTGQGTITVAQDQAPEAVLAYPSAGGPVDVTVSISKTTWFIQAMVVLIVGLVILAFAALWLWRELRPHPEPTSTDPDPSPAESGSTQTEPTQTEPEQAPEAPETPVTAEEQR